MQSNSLSLSLSLGIVSSILSHGPPRRDVGHAWLGGEMVVVDGPWLALHHHVTRCGPSPLFSLATIDWGHGILLCSACECCEPFRFAFGAFVEA